MAEKFVLDLIQPDWTILHNIAKEKGFNSFREMAPTMLESATANADLKFICDKTQRKFKNNFPIHHTLEEFYINLACKHSISVSSAIFRYVILPEIIDFQRRAQAGSGS